MTVAAAMSPPRPVIATLMANQANARLLHHTLGSDYALHPGMAETASTTLDKIDLILVDATCLPRERKRIHAIRRAAAPVVIPVLLLVDARQSRHQNLVQELGGIADDVLRIPTSQGELKARINNLLHLRRLSQQQDEARQQLEGVVSALHTLSACDRIVVGSTSEEQLLRDLCQTIVTEAGYNLAWVGFDSSTGPSPELDVRAAAGPALPFMAELEQQWQRDPLSLQFFSEVIHSGRTAHANELHTSAASEFMRISTAYYGIAAVIALPVRTETGPPGCLIICSSAADRFDDSERELLERLAENLAFGLNALRVREQREEQAAEIHYLAYTDALTGLPNRRHLIHYLDNVLAASTATQPPNGAMLFVDLDGFKLINDALGHEVGDLVLQQLSKRLKGLVREDDLVVRQGGDEFLVVLLAAPRAAKTTRIEDRAVRLAERIQQELGRPVIAGGYTHHLSASIGISLFPEHGREPATLIEKADTAMYEAKRQGGGRSHVFSPTISDRRQARFSMEAKLRTALEQNDFTLHYQPVVELHSRRVTGLEALIRWQQADGSLMPPGAFMPLVEELGLLEPVGDWVLATAAQQLAEWHARGWPLRMAVNVSLGQLRSLATADRLQALVAPWVAPHWLDLEVTENTLMTDPTFIEGLLAALHGHGFRIAIDDFGIGYSSLSRLQHLSIQTLKIDRSFTGQLEDPAAPKARALVDVILRMAETFELDVIAEGIETEGQRHLLLEAAGNHCLGQGFLFSHPLAANKVASLLSERTAL